MENAIFFNIMAPMGKTRNIGCKERCNTSELNYTLMSYLMKRPDTFIAI
jgi:hypothetical protein